MADTMPDLHPVESSMATHAGYDQNTNALYVTFKNGKTFRYPDVGADKAHTVLNAASFGASLNKHVLGKHEGRAIG